MADGAAKNKKSGLRERLARLSPAERHRLLAQLAMEKEPQPETTGPVRPVSVQQEYFWTLHQVITEPEALNNVVSMRVRGRFDPSTFRAALDQLVKRWQIFHSVYTSRDDKLRAILKPELSATWELQTIPADADREQWLRAQVWQPFAKPFDLATDCPLRCTVARTSENDHTIVFCIHHIAIDGSAWNHFWREIRKLYLACGSGEALPEPPPKHQYPAYAEKQAWRARLRPEPGAYWRKHLRELPEAPMPDREAPTAGEVCDGESQIHLPVEPQLWSAVAKAASASGSTPHNVFLTACFAWQLRYFGPGEFAIGTPINARLLTGDEQVLGCAINTLPIRQNVRPDQTFGELQRNVAQATRSAFEHGEIDLLAVLNELSREEGRKGPFFQTICQVRNFFDDWEALDPDGSVEMRAWPRYGAQVPLFLEIDPQPVEPRLLLTFDRHVIRRATAEGMLSSFRNLLTHILRHPHDRMASAPLLNAVDRSERLVALEQFKRQYPTAPNLWEQIVRKAGHRKGEVLIRFRDQEMDFSALRSRAEAIAAALQSLGVVKGDRVGVYLHRSLDLIPSLLGIMSAGAAYVPLDPEYPPQRNLHIARDAGLKVILTENALMGELPECEAQTLALEAVPDGAAPQPVAVLPEDLAYVIYTSGSTGLPKGVALEHRTVLNFLASMAEEPGFIAGDRLLATTTICFDISVLELFLPLVQGGEVVVGGEELRLDPQKLAATLTDERISVYQATPATWEMLVNSHWQGSSDLKALCGGEALPASLAADVVERCRSLWNLYGPTETTVWSCLKQIHPDEPVLIGLPIANTEVFVVDQEGDLTPPGVAGELLIGGAGLARGYWNREDLTAEKFITLEAEGIPPRRVYRTGDRARLLPNGELEFLGRLDNQVKIRGHRIELGEIEQCLQRLPDVERAVVDVRNGSGEPTLAAYVVPARLQERQAEFTTQLGDWLPAYMLPSAWVFLDTLPLTPNGKVNRKALPAPTAVTRDVTEPQTATEKIVAQIWSELLSVENVGREDDFFSLGGHSLTAIRCISRLRDNPEIVSADIRDLFRHPVLSEFANCLDSPLEPRSNDTKTLPAEERPKTDTTPATWAQLGIWLHSVAEDEPLLYLINERFVIRGPLDHHRLEAALQELIRRHDALRATFLEADGRLLMRMRDEVNWKMEFLDLVSDPNREQREEQTLKKVAETPFDIERDVMLRATLIRRTEQEHVLAFTVHHLIVDGTSLAIFYRQLGEIYRQKPFTQPAPCFLDHARFLAGYEASHEHRRNREFWTEQANLPVDHAEIMPDFQTSGPSCGPVQMRAHSLSSDLRGKLAQFAKEQRSTEPMVLLAVMFGLLHRCTGQTNLLIGSPVEGRATVTAEEMVGMFVDTLPLRVSCHEQDSFSDLVRKVSEVSLAAYAHYPVALDATQPADQGADSKLHHLFTYHAQGLPAPDLAEAQTERQEVEGVPAKFPLAIHAVPDSESLEVRCQFDSTRYQADRIEALLQHFINLLERAIANPLIGIGQINLLSPAEEQALTSDWTVSRSDYPRDQTVWNLFAEQVRLRPDSIALANDSGRWTYAELSDRAGQLAAALSRRGVDAGQRVGLCMERSREMIVGMLAILRCGAAYVPIDPEYPSERVSFMITDAELSGVLTHQPCFSRLHYAGIDAWRVEDLQGERNEPVEPATVSAMDPVYLMYTSGTTGQPKGTLIPQRGIVRLVKNTNYAELGPDQIVLQLCSPSFDVATFEIWGPLLNGGQLVLPPAGIPSVAEIGDAIKNHQVNTMWLTTGLFHLVVDEKIEILRPLRQLLAGGDIVSPTHVARVRRELPHIAMIDGYGPTENTTFSSFHLVEGEVDVNRSIPIGRPIANSEAFVLDGQMRPAPIGVPGELWVGGDGLALEYWKRPDLNAERFAKHPFREHARLYRTGDHARFLPEGIIEFLGRIDGQVKIRGFRVEFGEIESVLSGHESVLSCCAFCVGDPAVIGVGLVLKDEDASLEELKEYARNRLPGYTVPQRWLRLDSLPLTPSSKIDRRALAKQAASSAATGVAKPPANETEALLLDIWQRVLGRNDLGCDDDFFEAGGDSLAAMRLVAEYERRTNERLPLSDLFRRRNIVALAQSRAGGDSHPSTLVPLRPGKTDCRIYLIHGWGGEVFGQLELARRLPEGLTVFGINSVERSGESERLDSFEEMGERYAEDICRDQPDGPCHVCGFSLGGMIAFETARHLQLKGREVRLFVLDTYTRNVPRSVDAKMMLPFFVLRAGHHLRHLFSIHGGIRDYLRGRARALNHHLHATKKPQPTGAKRAEDHYEQVWRQYRPRPVSLSVTVLQSRQNKRNLRALWSYLSKGRARRLWFPGAHLESFTDPEVARQIGEELLR